MYLKLHQDKRELLLNVTQVSWIARYLHGKTRIRVGEDKLVVDESFEQVQAFWLACDITILEQKAEMPLTKGDESGDHT